MFLTLSCTQSMLIKHSWRERKKKRKGKREPRKEEEKEGRRRKRRKGSLDR